MIVETLLVLPHEFCIWKVLFPVVNPVAVYGKVTLGIVVVPLMMSVPDPDTCISIVASNPPHVVGGVTGPKTIEIGDSIVKFNVAMESHPLAAPPAKVCIYVPLAL